MDVAILLCVGRMRGQVADAAADYASRISRYARISVIEVEDEPDPAHDTYAANETVRAREGARLLKHIKPSDFVIALCVRGRQMTSEEWASFIEAQSARRLVFIIGGSLGLSEAVYARADALVSFSKMTFPHQLMRVMLLEQVYRAMKINAGERYHK